MFFYRLSEGQVRRVIAHPDRREGGIAPNTIALMQRHDTPRRKEEIWVMIAENAKDKDQKSKTIVISAWRYPGVTKLGVAPPMPEGLLDEILESMRI